MTHKTATELVPLTTHLLRPFQESWKNRKELQIILIISPKDLKGSQKNGKRIFGRFLLAGSNHQWSVTAAWVRAAVHYDGIIIGKPEEDIPEEGLKGSKNK